MKREHLGPQEPLGVDNPNLTLLFDELGDDSQYPTVEEALRSDSGFSDDFFTNNSASTEEYESYFNKAPLAGSMDKKVSKASIY